MPWKAGFAGCCSGPPSAMNERQAPALVLFQPERPHNFGAALRLCACLGTTTHIIEPSGFPLDDRRIREAALDYTASVTWHAHADLAAFLVWQQNQGRRLVLLSRRAEKCHHHVVYSPDDLLVVGCESSGAPALLHAAASLRVRIPLQPGCRSLNVVIAAAIVLGEAMRQTGSFDGR